MPLIPNLGPSYGGLIDPVFSRAGPNIGPFSRPYTVVDVGATGNANRGSLNTQSGTAANQATVAGLNTALPLIYGRQRVGARITSAVVHANTGNLVLRCCWCIGEVDAIVSVTDANGQPLHPNIIRTDYLGTTSQGVDPALQSAWAAAGKTYNDTLAGDGITRPATCYSSFEIPPGVLNGFPRFVADIRGLKVRSTEGGARAWSETDAYILADFITSTLYGMGELMDWATVATIAAENATSIGTPAEAKRTLNLVMATPQDCRAWLNILREYAGCWAYKEGGRYRLVSRSMPAAGSAKTVTGITKAKPPVVTSTAHGFANGDIVQLASVAGMTQANTRWGVVTVVNANSFSLRGLDSTSWSTYTSGGTATKIETSALSLTPANILKGSARFQLRGLLSAPTVVEVGYTNTTTNPWREDTATAYASGVLAGTVPRRSAQFGMPGFTRYSEAYRFAVERLNAAQLADLGGSVGIFDDGLKLLVGELVDVTHDVGLDAKVMRIVRIDPMRAGRWTLALEEWDPLLYSTVVVAAPSTDDTTLPSPTAPPRPTSLSITEDVYQVETGRYSSRLSIHWGEPSYPFIANYSIEVTNGGMVVDSALRPKGTTEYVTPPLAENATYLVAVKIISVTGQPGTPITDTKTLDGKLARPSDIPRFTGYEVGGEVRLEWDLASDLDLTATELRYGAVGGSYETANIIDRVPHPAQRYATRAVPEGIWTFYAKALDSVRTATYPYGQESVNAASLPISVTSDTGAFIATRYTFATPTLSKMRADDEGAGTFWVTDFAQTWDSLFPSTMSGYTNPVWSYHSSGNSGFVSEVFDATASLTGDWRASVDYQNITGTATAILDLNNVGGEATKTITDATNATPIVITSTAHGYANGDEVVIAGVGGNTAANGRWLVKNVAANTFEITDLYGYNVAGNGAYTSGGTASRWVWNSYVTLNAKTTARYARLRVGTTGTGTLRVDGLGAIDVAVVARREGGTVTVAANPTTVVFSGKYNAAIAATATAIGTAGHYASVDMVEVSQGRGVQSGRLLRFDGVNDYVDMGDQAVHTMSTGSADTDFTLEALIRADDFAAAGIVAGKSSDGIAGEFVMYLASGGQLVASVMDTTAGGRKTFSSAIVLTPKVWWHIAFVFTASGATGQLYLDGVPITTLVGTVGTYTRMRDTAYTFAVGRQAVGNYFKGCIDEVRLWNVARTQAQIAANYQAALTSGTGLVGRWGFDETSGTTANDSTANAKHGTHNGGVAIRPYDGMNIHRFDAAGAFASGDAYYDFAGI